MQEIARLDEQGLWLRFLEYKRGPKVVKVTPTTHFAKKSFYDAVVRYLGDVDVVLNEWIDIDASKASSGEGEPTQKDLLLNIFNQAANLQNLIWSNVYNLENNAYLNYLLLKDERVKKLDMDVEEISASASDQNINDLINVANEILVRASSLASESYFYKSIGKKQSLRTMALFYVTSILPILFDSVNTPTAYGLGELLTNKRNKQLHDGLKHQVSETDRIGIIYGGSHVSFIQQSLESWGFELADTLESLALPGDPFKTQ